MKLNNLAQRAAAFDYFLVRAKQLLKHNFGLVGFETISYEGAVVAYFGKQGPDCKSVFDASCEKFCSIYIFEEYRGLGLFETIYNDICTNNKRNFRVLTSKQCGIEDFLEKKEYPYVSVDLSLGFIEYDIISEYYGNDIAKRSGVRLMNHIDEGLRVMKDIHASEDSMRAYCIHPIVQTEDDLSKFNLTGVSDRVMELALEYKRIANAYLSTRTIESIDEIELGCIEVNDMLIADKIQNKKDFDIYHKGKHERSVELEQYFANWFKRLGINALYNIEIEKIR